MKIALQSLLILFALASTSAESNNAPPIVAVAPTVAAESNGNVATQLFGYVKDSVVRCVSGSKEMWSNHGKCKEIRSKQKDYRDKLKGQWELQEKNLSPQDMKRRLASVNGGISYDEFIFLTKGKEDRGKLMNLVFLMYGAPKVFPYALMFYPDMLPGPFAPLKDASGKENKLEKLSRQRAHAVMQTFMSLEKEAKTIPALAKLNIFGRKKQERAMNRIDGLAKTGYSQMVSPNSLGAAGAEGFIQKLEGLLYKTENFSRGEKRLENVPHSIISGLLSSINGPGPLSAVTPNFMRRGTVTAHVQKITEADNFLVNESVELGSLSTIRLLEACNDRMIGVSGRTDEEMRNNLSAWLDLAVVKPKARTSATNEFYNENLGRAALLGFFSVDAARDERCTSYLVRSMFQGAHPVKTIEDGKKKK